MKENSCPCLFAIFHNLIAALAPTERIFIFPSHAGDAYVSSPISLLKIKSKIATRNISPAWEERKIKIAFLFLNFIALFIFFRRQTILSLVGKWRKENRAIKLRNPYAGLDRWDVFSCPFVKRKRHKKAVCRSFFSLRMKRHEKTAIKPREAHVWLRSHGILILPMLSAKRWEPILKWERNQTRHSHTSITSGVSMWKESFGPWALNPKRGYRSVGP